jgi:hypothetical protein
VAWVLAGSGVLVAAAGCGAAENAVNQVADRGRREAYCAQWRIAREVADRRDDPRVAQALLAARNQLLGLVPDEQRASLDSALEQAGELAELTARTANRAAGTIDEAALNEAEQAFDDAVAKIESSCDGTLTG